MTQNGAAVVLVVRPRGTAAGQGDAENILGARPSDGPGAGMVSRLPGRGGGGGGADMFAALCANGTPGGMVYQYNCNTGALTRLPGLGGGDNVLALLRLAAAVNEPGADILGALRANESGAVFCCISGKVPQEEELGLVAIRGEEPGMDAGRGEGIVGVLPADGAVEVFRAMLVYEPGTDAGRDEGIVGVLPADGAGEVFRAMLVHEPGMDVGRVEGIASVLPANGAATVQPYKTGTIPHFLGKGGGRGEGIARVLPANHPAAVYYYKLPNSPREASMGGHGRGEGLTGLPIPAKGPGSGVNQDSGMSKDKTAMAAAEHVVTFSEEAFGCKATGDPVAAAGGTKLAGHVRRGLEVVGVAAASLAFTGLAAGAGTAAAGFGLFTALLYVVSLVTLRVLDA